MVFSPGPWLQDEACICSQDGTPVAATCRRDEFWSTSDDDMPDEEIERIAANARLIVAAPDLLGAAKAWIDYLDAANWLAEEAPQTETRLLSSLRAAISKALIAKQEA